MTQEALNIAGQCRATASSPLAKNILVDEGNGLLTELLLDAARIIEALAQPEQEPVAYWKFNNGFSHCMIDQLNEAAKKNPAPLYTTPPRRTEQEPLFKKIIDQHPGLAEELKALDEQEPVAWFSPSGNLYKTRFHATANGEQVVTPLYTTSSPRKPLTENEIKHLWYEACQTNLELTSQLIVHLARNIEAAHGIKE